MELTYHGDVHINNTQISWGLKSIFITVPNPGPFLRILIEGLGFRHIENNTLILPGLLGWSCTITIDTGERNPTMLDSSGPTCLAFYSNHIEEDSLLLQELGSTEKTEIFDLTLGERIMTVIILRTPGGPLLELISPRRRNVS